MSSMITCRTIVHRGCLLCGFVLALILHPSVSIDAEPLRLARIAEMALARNIGLKIAAVQIEERLLDLKKAQNDFLPNLDLRLSTSRKTVLDQQQKANPFLYERTTLYSLDLVQKFPALGKANELARDVADLRTQAARVAAQNARRRLLREVITTYFKIFREQERRKLHEENRFLAGKLLEVAKINESVGLSLQNDILRIEVQIANFEASIVDARNSAATLMQDLATLLDLHDASALEPAFPASLKFTPQEMSASAALQLMLQADYELQLARTDLNIMRKTVRAAKSAHLPTLTLSGNYTHGKEVGPYNGTKDYTVAFSLDMPVYDSGDIQNEVRRTHKQAEIASLTCADLENRKRGAVIKAWTDYHEVLERIRFAEKAVEQSRENMRVVSTRYKAGDASIVELVDAQLTLSSTAQTAISAYYDERIRYAELLFLTGQEEAALGMDQGAFPPLPGFNLVEDRHGADTTATATTATASADASEAMTFFPLSPTDLSGLSPGEHQPRIVPALPADE